MQAGHCLILDLAKQELYIQYIEFEKHHIQMLEMRIKEKKY